MSDIALLRLVLARELETINEYEEFSRRAESEDLQAFFRHLAKEEKEHVSEAMALINSLDPEQAAEWDEVNISSDHFVGADRSDSEPTQASVPEVAEDTPAPKAPRILAPHRPKFTVGSLKRRD